MIKFRQKDFSILSSTTKGATLGAGIGTLLSGLSGSLPKKLDGDSEFSKSYNTIPKKLIPLSIIGVSTFIGAALGALGGTLSSLSEKVSRSRVNNRLMKSVIDDLNKTGFKEGVDYTRNPKTANDLKTKVCIVITRVSGDLKILVNTISDVKLKRLTESITKNIPNTSVVNRNASDKFNDITLSTISDSSADSGLITGIAESFIRTGYPVYLVEVG